MCKELWRLDYGLDERGILIPFPTGTRDVSVLRKAKTDLESTRILTVGRSGNFLKLKPDNQLWRLNMSGATLIFPLRLHVIAFTLAKANQAFTVQATEEEHTRIFCNLH